MSATGEFAEAPTEARQISACCHLTQSPCESNRRPCGAHRWRRNSACEGGSRSASLYGPRRIHPSNLFTTI